jgi:pyruvate-formate lyase
MSELKVYHHELRHNEYEEFYLKYEADKVIAEKDAEIVELKKQVLDYAQGLYVIQARAEKEARHQKYRRCLAMASNCRLRARWFGDNAFYKKEQWALQWHARWLELAEKFKDKEAK